MSDNHIYNFFLFLCAILFFAGLENIDVPPFDSHDWRQTLTISMSQEFSKLSHFVYPPTIIGDGTDTIASEVPFLNSILALCYKIFGYRNWYGRLVNWSIACLGLIYFFKLVKHFWGNRPGLYASVIMASSIIFQYSRKTMPDTFSLFLAIIGSYFIIQFINNGKARKLAIGTVLLLIAGLSKLPFIIIWSFVAYEIIRVNNVHIKRKKITSITLVFSFLLVVLWYFIWVPHLISNGASQLFWSFDLNRGYEEMIGLKPRALTNFFTNTFHFVPLTFISVIGLGTLFIKEKSMALFAFGYIAFFTLLVIKSGNVYPTHDYYNIPIIPLLSIGCGILIDKTFNSFPIAIIITLLLCLPGFKYNKKASFNGFETRYYEGLASFLDENIEKDAVLVVNGGAFNPNFMFWTKRKGWTYKTEDFIKPNYLISLHKRGMDYIVQDKNLMRNRVPFEVLDENDDFILYKPKLIQNEEKNNTLFNSAID